MAEPQSLLVRFTCARADAETLAQALREAASGPIAWHETLVLGHDYADAGTGEQVEGLLRRAVLEIVVPAPALEAVVAAAQAARCRAPLRWHAVPLHAQGRIA